MSFTTRPVYMATNGIVTSTHYLASEAGYMALKRGGNVVDAGVTMWFMLTLLKPHLVGVAGEVPILIYWADDEKVIAVNGQGPAPKTASIDWFLEHGYPLIPEDGFLPAVVPGAFDAWLLALDEYGTFSFSQAIEPALRQEIEEFFTQRSIEMPSSNIKQAALIPSASAIHNIRGTAPGWWVERDGRVLITMPGAIGATQAASSAPERSSSTRHSRQAPVGVR